MDLSRALQETVRSCWSGFRACLKSGSEWVQGMGHDLKTRPAPSLHPCKPSEGWAWGSMLGLIASQFCQGKVMHELELPRLPRIASGRRDLPWFLCRWLRAVPSQTQPRPLLCNALPSGLSRKPPGCLSLGKLDRPSPLPEPPIH